MAGEEKALELATAYVSLSVSAKGLRQEIDKELGGAGDAAAKKTSKSFGDNLKKWGKRGVAVAGGAIATGLGVALTKGLGRLTAIENAEAKMRGLGFATEQVDRIMSKTGPVMNSVKGTAFGLGEAATTAAGALAAGVDESTELEGYLKAVANSAAAAGIGMDEMGSIFNKVQSLGKAQNDVLQQVADRGIPIYQALADQFGVTTDEVFKMASAGEISAKDFQEAMTTASGTVAEEMGNTFTGSLQNMWASFGRIGANLLSGVFDKFAPALQTVTGWLGKLEPVATAVGEAIGNFANRAIEALGALWDLIAKGDFTGAFRESFGLEEDHPVILFFFDLRDKAVQVFEDIKTGIGLFGDAWKRNDGAVTSSGLPGFFESLANIGRTVFDTIKDGIAAFGDAWKNNDGVIANTGIPGVLERIGYWARQAFDYVRDTVIPSLQNFVTEFQNGEGAGGAFRDVLNGVWEALKGAFNFVADTVVPALDGMLRFLRDNKDIVVALTAGIVAYNAVMKTMEIVTKAVTVAKAAWAAIMRVVNTVMKLNPIGLVIAAITALIAVVIYAYKENDQFRAIVDKAWSAVKKAIEAVVNWFRNTAWPWMRDTINSLRDRFVAMKDGVVDAWERVRSGISSGWDKIKGYIDRFKESLSSLKDRFGNVKDGIKTVWDKLVGVVTSPINKVIGKINDFLKNLKSGLNKIPGVNLTGDWTIPTVQFTSGGHVAPSAVALAAGGKVPGWSPNDEADNIPAWLTAGEYVLPVKAVRRLRKAIGEGGLEALRRGVPAFASGGLVGGRERGTGGWLSKAWDSAVDLWNRGKDWVFDLIKGILPDPAEFFGNSWVGQVVRGIIGNLNLQSIADSLTDSSQKELGGSANTQMVGGQRINYPGHPYGWASQGMPWQSIWAIIQRLAPEARMTSNYRPGAITASGVPSLHGQGRAVDIVSSNMAATFNKIAGALPWSQLYYSPMGGRQIGYRDAAVHRMHFDHIHAALAKGGWVRSLGKPMVADSGATLAPGLNLLDNRTGGPEPLGRLDQPLDLSDETIDKLADAIILGARRTSMTAIREYDIRKRRESR